MTDASSQPVVGVTREVTGECAVPGTRMKIARPGPDGIDRAMDRETLLGFVGGLAGLITWVSERVDAELLDAAGDRLQVVSNYAVGVDNVDLEACRERGVVVTNVPDAVTEGTANLAMALLLGAARRIGEGDRFVRRGAWTERGVLGPTDFLGRHLNGGTLLIVGAGRIGLATALRAKAFGMHVEYVARSRHWNFELAPVSARKVDLDQGLRSADAVSLHCPLTPETRHLIGARELRLMKPTAILVNTARGPVVDEDALTDALDSGSIFAAGLDVFEREPDVGTRIRSLENVLLTPHIGSAETRYREEMTAIACANVAAVLDGRDPANRVV